MIPSVNREPEISKNGSALGATPGVAAPRPDISRPTGLHGEHGRTDVPSPLAHGGDTPETNRETGVHHPRHEGVETDAPLAMIGCRYHRSIFPRQCTSNPAIMWTRDRDLAHVELWVGLPKPPKRTGPSTFRPSWPPRAIAIEDTRRNRTRLSYCQVTRYLQTLPPLARHSSSKMRTFLAPQTSRALRSSSGSLSINLARPSSPIS